MGYSEETPNQSKTGTQQGKQQILQPMSSVCYFNFKGLRGSAPPALLPATCWFHSLYKSAWQRSRGSGISSIQGSPLLLRLHFTALHSGFSQPLALSGPSCRILLLYTDWPRSSLKPWRKNPTPLHSCNCYASKASSIMWTWATLPSSAASLGWTLNHFSTRVLSYFL